MARRLSAPLREDDKTATVACTSAQAAFSREARYEADRSRVPLTLLAMPDLRELLVNHYEDLDPETRALVPLKKVYWPVAE